MVRRSGCEWACGECSDRCRCVAEHSDACWCNLHVIQGNPNINQIGSQQNMPTTIYSIPIYNNYTSMGGSSVDDEVQMSRDQARRAVRRTRCWNCLRCTWCKHLKQCRSQQRASNKNSFDDGLRQNQQTFRIHPLDCLSLNVISSDAWFSGSNLLVVHRGHAKPSVSRSTW